MKVETQWYESYDEWKAAGNAAGLDGPYAISGQPHMHQFVAPAKGTLGLWNAESGRGYLYLERQ